MADAWPDREQLAWAAGFFDGEGWIGFAMRTATHRGGRKYRRLEIGITQHHPVVLERFQTVMRNLGTVKGPYYPAVRGRTSERWYYNAAGFQHVQQIVAALFPFLSDVKRDQALDAMKAWHAAEVYA